MKLAGITERCTNLRQRIQLRRQLKNYRYVDSQISPEEHRVYNNTMLRHITGLAKTSIDKAHDMAYRLRENFVNTPDCGIPNDWKYLIGVYKYDFSFIKNCFNDTPLKDIEALYHAKERTSVSRESAICYYNLPNNLKYLFLDLKEEYPEQVNKILKTKKYADLFGCKASEVPDIKTARRFAELLRDESELINRTLTEINKSELTEPHTFTVPEVLFVANAMKKDANIVKDLFRYSISPELIGILAKHSDKTDVLKGFDIYCEHYASERTRNEIEKDSKRKFYFVSDKTNLKNMDTFLEFFGKLQDVLRGKENECIDPENKDIVFKNIANGLLNNVESGIEYSLAGSCEYAAYPDKNSAIAFACKYYRLKPEDLLRQKGIKELYTKNPKFLLRLLQDNSTYNHGEQGLYLLDNCQRSWENEYIFTRYS